MRTLASLLAVLSSVFLLMEVGHCVTVDWALLGAVAGVVMLLTVFFDGGSVLERTRRGIWLVSLGAILLVGLGAVACWLEGLFEGMPPR